MSVSTPTYLRTVADLDAVRAEAATMTTSCPLCGASDVKVREQVKQATRREPAILLGFQGFCVACQVSVPADTVQFTLETS